MKDYQNFSKEELIKEIEKLKKQKKFGLIWEEENVVENFDKLSINSYPILEEIEDKKINSSITDDYNFLIEGDNYHALSVLNYTHKSSIDLIYIDPPYNTGAKNWIYNNKFVDQNDSYRHSKWLSMMNKRLKLAKDLLTENGSLICAIDENEVTRLGLLLEEIFTDKELHLITIVHNPRGIQGKNFSYINEFAYFLLPKNKKIIQNRKIDKDDTKWRNLRDNGGESLRQDARNCFYPIIIQDEKIVGFGDVCEKEFHPNNQTIKFENKFYVYPIDKSKIERKWRYARQSVEAISKILRVKKNKENYEIEIGKDFGTYPTVWQNARYDSNEYGKKIIGTLVPNTEFDYPKSIYNVYDCLYSVIGNNKNAVVLDFFAGSGTTAHSLLLLNKEDNGNRKFILCTNNENEIAEKICYERVKNVILGNKKYSEITNIPANLKYYKIEFVKKSINKDQLKKDLTKKCTELLCVKENIFEKKIFNKDYSLFENHTKALGIFYSNNYKLLEDLKIKIRKTNKIKIIYIFTLNNSDIDNLDFEDFNDIQIKPIPQKIVDIYESLNEF